MSLEGRGTWGTRSPGTSVWGTLLPSPTCPTPVSPSGLNSTVSSLLKCVHLFHPSGVSLCSVVPAEASWQDSHRTILIILPPVLAGLSPHRMVTSWSRVRFCSQLYACTAGDLGSIPGLGRSLEEGKATHSSILAWRICGPYSPWGPNPVILISACASSSPAFLMMYSAYKLNKQGDNIQP